MMPNDEKLMNKSKLIFHPPLQYTFLPPSPPHCPIRTASYTARESRDVWLSPVARSAQQVEATLAGAAHR